MINTNVNKKESWRQLSKTLAHVLRSNKNKDGITINDFKKTKKLPQWIINLNAWQIASFAFYDKQRDGTNRFHLYIWSLNGKKKCCHKDDIPNLPSLVNNIYITAEPSIKQKNIYYKNNVFIKINEPNDDSLIKQNLSRYNYNNLQIFQ